MVDTRWALCICDLTPSRFMLSPPRMGRIGLILITLLTVSCGEKKVITPTKNVPTLPPTPITADLEDERIQLAIQDLERKSRFLIKILYTAMTRLDKEHGSGNLITNNYDQFEALHEVRTMAMHRSLGTVSAVYDAEMRIYEVPSTNDYYALHFHHNGALWRSTDLYYVTDGLTNNYYIGKALTGNSLRPFFEFAWREFLGAEAEPKYPPRPGGQPPKK